MVTGNKKKNHDDATATGDCKKEGINEDIEANDVGIPVMKTKLIMKKIMKRKKKFSFSVQRSDFNKCCVNISFFLFIKHSGTSPLIYCHNPT